MYSDDDVQRLVELGRTDDEIKTIVEEDRFLDQKIHKAALEEWINVFVRMWDAIGKDVDDRRLDVYVREFSCIPLGLLELSVKRAVRNNGAYLTVPSVSALWAAIRKETGDLPIDVMEAVDVWKDRQVGFIYRFEQVADEQPAIE